MTLQAHVAATGTLVATPARLKSLVLNHGVTGGSIILKDGGSGGTVELTIITPAAVGSMTIPIGGAGQDFGTDIHATLDDVTGLTAFYETF